MTDMKPITNRAEHEVALARLREVFHSAPETPEGSEARALAQVIHDYEKATFEIWNTPTDAVHQIEFMLDQETADLPGLLEVFGGRQPFLEFMLRRQPLDDATIDSILARYNTKREWLDKPFCEPPGWENLLDGEWLRAGLDAMEAGHAHEPVAEMVSGPGLEPEREPELVAAAGG